MHISLLPTVYLIFWVFFIYLFFLVIISYDEMLQLRVNCDGVVLEIYLDQKFQWPLEVLNSESLEHEVDTWPTMVTGIGDTNRSRARHDRYLIWILKCKINSTYRKKILAYLIYTKLFQTFSQIAVTRSGGISMNNLLQSIFLQERRKFFILKDRKS